MGTRPSKGGAAGRSRFGGGRRGGACVSRAGGRARGGGGGERRAREPTSPGAPPPPPPAPARSRRRRAPPSPRADRQVRGPRWVAGGRGAVNASYRPLGGARGGAGPVGAGSCGRSPG